MRIGFKKGRKERKKKKFNDTFIYIWAKFQISKSRIIFPVFLNFREKKKKRTGRERKGEERREKDSFNEYCGKKKEKEKEKEKKKKVFAYIFR